MKTLSLILTILLVLPLGSAIFSFYESHMFRARFDHTTGLDQFDAQSIAQIAVHVIYIAVAISLHVKEKFFVNSIICGTLLVTFFVWLITFYGINIAYMLSNSHKL